MFVEFLQVYLPIIINVLLIVFLIVAIIIGIKLSDLIDKANHVADSVSEKLDSLNGLFKAIDFASDKVNSITNKTVDAIVSALSKIFSRRSKKIKFDEEED